MDVYFQNPENTVTYNPVREFYLNSIILEVLVGMGSLQNQEGLIWSHSILRQNDRLEVKLSYWIIGDCIFWILEVDIHVHLKPPP